MPFGGLLTAGIITAGASIFGAKKSSDAAKNAAKTQSDAADRALEFEKQQYGEAQRNLSPWMALGNGAAAKLAAKLGVSYLGQGPGGPVNAADVERGMVPLSTFSSIGSSVAAQPRAAATRPLPQMADSADFSGLVGTPSRSNGYGTPSTAAPTATPAAMSATITLRSPDGETRQFARTDPRVEGYKARGATEVG